jgi:hypothetical protein
MLLKWAKEFVFLLVLLVALCSSSFLPTSLERQGNKKREPPKIQIDRSGTGYFYSSGCEQRVKNWSGWSGGLNGKILVKEAGDPALPAWSVVIQLDKSVDKLQAYDTKTEKLDDRTYKISPLSWNAEIKEEAEKTVNLQVWWPQGEAEPKIRSLYVNGESFECMPDAEESNPPPQEASVGQAENNSSEAPNNNGTSRPPTTTMKTFVPTVAGERGIFAPWPKQVMGLYVLLADNSEKGFEDHVDWQPKLYPYMQTGANVLFFTFIHPTTMKVPPAFINLAKTRGTNQPGAVPKDTVILFALGGYAYSVQINPWPWLTSRSAAEEMAEKVARWPTEYGCDGIDLDIEDGAGDAPGAGQNMIYFIQKLRQLNPKMIIGQPTYGFPAIRAEIDVINASWDENGNNKNIADSIGLMVYEGTNSLNYVKNYVAGTSRWEGFKIKVNAPSNTILLGAKGSTSPATINTLVNESLKNDYLGVMVWFASVVDGLQYGKGVWDASTSKPTQEAYINGMKRFRSEL